MVLPFEPGEEEPLSRPISYARPRDDSEFISERVVLSRLGPFEKNTRKINDWFVQEKDLIVEKVTLVKKQFIKPYSLSLSNISQSSSNCPVRFSHFIFRPAFSIHATMNPDWTKTSRKLLTRRFRAREEHCCAQKSACWNSVKMKMAPSIFVTRFFFSKVDFKFKS